MNKFICIECGTRYRSPEKIPPSGIKWSNGHICVPKPVLVLEVGEYYMLRNNLITSALRKSNTDDQLFEGYVIESSDKTPSIFSWNQDGKCLNPSQDEKYDIVEKIKTK